MDNLISYAQFNIYKSKNKYPFCFSLKKIEQSTRIEVKQF